MSFTLLSILPIHLPPSPNLHDPSEGLILGELLLLPEDLDQAMELHVVVGVDVFEDSFPFALVDELLALSIEFVLVDVHLATILIAHHVDDVSARL